MDGYLVAELVSFGGPSMCRHGVRPFFSGGGCDGPIPRYQKWVGRLAVWPVPGSEEVTVRDEIHDSSNLA